jgi:hypothetical protein
MPTLVWRKAMLDWYEYLEQVIILFKDGYITEKDMRDRIVDAREGIPGFVNAPIEVQYIPR